MVGAGVTLPADRARLCSHAAHRGKAGAARAFAEVLGGHLSCSSQGCVSPTTTAERSTAQPAQRNWHSPEGNVSQGRKVTGGNFCGKPVYSGDLMRLVQSSGNSCSGGCWN